jgi:GT2 family glycosyltransferase
MEQGVSIVIPTWNGRPLLERFLPSVINAANHYSRESRSPVEILLVDDGSSDGTAEWAEQQRSGCDRVSLSVLQNARNLGFGEACNRGVAASRYPLVLLVNNDVELAPDSIAPLVKNFAEPPVFAAHCRVFDLETGHECGSGKLGSFARGFIRVHESYSTRGGAAAGLAYSMFAGGGSAMFDRKKFLGIGGFDPLLAPFYWEDVELSYRAWKRGYTVVYEPGSVARHQISSTIRFFDQKLVRRIQQRNRLIYHWVHLHDPSLIASHLLWLCILLATAPLRLQPGFILSFLSALRLVRRVSRRRAEEKKQAKRRDREVFGLFESLKKTGLITPEAKPLQKRRK